MKRKRVLVTGMGVFSAAGSGKEAYWTALRCGQSLISPIRRFDTAGYRTRIAATIDEGKVPVPYSKTDPNLWDLSASIALLSIREALEDAGWQEPPQDAAIVLGSAVAGIVSLDQQFENFYTRGGRFVMPYTVPRIMLNAPAALASIELGIRGPMYMLGTACSSSSQAIGLGCRLIACGLAQTCIAGGTESPVSPGHLQAWDRLRALSKDNETPWRACRPFSRNRSGLVLGEGAAALILEERESAIARGARSYGEIVGYASNSDAHQILQPSVESQEDCIRAALSDAGRSGALPDYICAHGTATIEGDRKETEAIKACFGSKASQIPISGTKSMTGHTLGASGALGLVSTFLAMRDDLLPPTAHLEEPDPECDLDYVPNTSRLGSISLALVNSFGFGGCNAVLVVSR
ncbi:MAG: beta-ketoacyl-[acyl-carrier-protein] synthase family protein [Acidobacteria bacterium]|nr:MAG: beta-ketoacyl-[acyl-carrier-protein] synthase family protein [Acidobacteriota bacterium]